MRRLRAWFLRVGSLFNKQRGERELSDELESHLQMHIEDNLRRGMTPDEARRKALIKLGGVEQAKENYRDQRGIPFFETVMQDLRYGFRMLRKNPGFAAVAVLTLALGIGANTAIFSVVRAVLLKPLPYPDSSQLMVMREYQIGGSDMSVNWLNFADWRTQSRFFEQMAAYNLAHFTLTGEGEPVLLRGATVSASYFPLLGRAQPLLGRVFTNSDDQAGAASTVILSHDLWEERLGSDPSVVGKTIALDGKAYIVVGVLGSEFKEPLVGRNVDLYIPIGPGSGHWQARDQRGSIAVIARLRPGVTLTSARSEMDTIERRLELQFPKTNQGVRASITPLYEYRFGDLRPVLFTLLAAVGMVLLIACANVANLSIARAVARRREFGIRSSCGASRSRLIGQLLMESTLLSCLGGAAGLLLARWALGLILRLAPPGIPRLQETRMDSGVLVFTLIVSLLTGVLAGLGPGLEASKLSVVDLVKDGGTTTGRSLHRWQSSFLFAEIALAFVLVLASGLLVRSLIKTQQVDPGFNPDQVLVLELVLPQSSYATAAQQTTFYRQALARFSALPGVKSVGMVVCPPAVGHCWDWFYTVEDHPAPSSEKLPVSAFNQATPSYFQTMGVPLLAGRAFTEQDDAHTPPVVIVNQTFARLWWPNASPIGKRIRLWDAGGTTPYREIVGLIGDIKEDGLDAEQIPEVFMPSAQEPTGGMTFVMRSSVDPTDLVRPVTEAVHELDKNLPIQRIQPMSRYLQNSLAQRRFAVLLVGLFGALALALGAVGIYGVMSYAVSRRTHEIGIRMALGAERGHVLSLVLNQGLRAALTGLALGIALSLAVTRFLRSLLFGVTTTDPATFAGVAVLLCAVALAACVIPIWRATRVDPMVALRYE
jgi:predicted permease